MKLQILINHYQESLEIVWRQLRSIEEQCLPDETSLEILICTDGYETELTGTNFENCRVPVRYFVRPHYGVCRTRNELLDLSDADYLMFCDCDDMFSKPDGLQKLLVCALQTKADVIGSDYDIELKRNDDFVYRTAHQNVSRLHGKIFKREYLLREQIRYPDEMTFSGDMYFLYLVYHLTGKIVWLPDNFYIWKWRPESVTRGKSHYSVRTYGQMNKCYVLVARELLRRGRMDLCEELVVSRMNAAYIDFFSQRFNDAPRELSDNARESICEIAREFYDIYLSVPVEIRRRNYINLLLSRRTYGPPEKFAGLEKWLQSLLKGGI